MSHDYTLQLPFIEIGVPTLSRRMANPSRAQPHLRIVMNFGLAYLANLDKGNSLNKFVGGEGLRHGTQLWIKT